jgi:hypothetical protein
LKIRVRMMIDGQAVKEAELSIADHKLDGLSEEEVERAAEIVVSECASSQVVVEWEADPDSPGESFEAEE